MKEKLIIKNFGPIKSVDLDLGKITVLVGEQASGKSTIAKVLAICRYFSYIVDDSESIVNHKSSFELNALDDWGLRGYEKPDTYIKYQNKDYSVEIESKEISVFGNTGNEGDEVEICQKVLIPKLEPKSKQFENLLKSYNNLKPERDRNFGIYPGWSIPHSFLMTDVKNVMDNPFYFPTERGLQSIFSIGKRGVENLSDSLYKQLVKINEKSSSFNEETKIEPLGLIYKNQNGEGYIKLDGEKDFYKLSQGASGYKSSIPIILVVKYYELRKKRKTFIIEEPEQNLFPKAQKQLVEFLVQSTNKYDNSFIIPTHSPYIISVLNNLLTAYRIGQQHPEEVEKIYKKQFWLSSINISAYSLEFDEAESGVISKNLILEDLKEISIDYLDGISSDINHDWDEMVETTFSDEG